MWGRKAIIWSGCLTIIGIGLWVGAQMSALIQDSTGAGVSLNQPVLAQEAGTPVSSGLVVDARVLPARQARLSFAVSGVLAGLEVSEGDFVEAGDILARLDAAQQQAAVSRSRAELARAQARLDELLAGARGEEIMSAQAGLAAAQARLTRIESGSLPNDTAAAEATLAAAQANLRRILEGASEQELIAARAEMANAQAAVGQAQAAYDQVKWRADIGALPQAADLERATNNLEAAQARLANLENGVRQSDIDAGNAEIRRASAQLAQLQATLPADVAAARADVQQFEAQLALLLAGTRPEQVTAAQADVDAATAALQQALVSYAEATLYAPISGTVATLDVSLGEQMQPGLAVMQLADLGEWEIRTEGLTELDVVGTLPGEQVAVSFDAIPGLDLVGEVTRIRPQGADQRGDIVYTVVIRLLENDPRLLWNMTAVVRFADR